MLSFRRGTFCSTNLQIKSNTPSSEIHREKLIFPRQMSKTILLRVNFSSLVKPSISPFACKIIQAKVYSSHLFPIFRIQTIESHFSIIYSPFYPIKLIKRTSTKIGTEDRPHRLSLPLSHPPISINQPAKWLFLRSKPQQSSPLIVSLSLQFHPRSFLSFPHLLDNGS